MTGAAASPLGPLGRTREIVFQIGMAALFTHELDAMTNHEWRGMPILGSLPDATAMTWFVVGHIPLFAVLVALVSSSKPRVRALSRLVIGGFLVLHGVLHALSMGEPTYEFHSTLSNALIFGAAACGVLYLGLEALQRSVGRG